MPSLVSSSLSSNFPLSFPMSRKCPKMSRNPTKKVLPNLRKQIKVINIIKTRIIENAVSQN